VIVKASPKADWYIWQDPDLAWCRENEQLPGLRFNFKNGKIVVDFHVSHIPCMPQDVQTAATCIQQPCQYQVNTALLRSYQADDLAFLNSRHGVLLCYEMRLGKTAVACHLHDPNSGLLVIVGPLAAREAWRDWVGRTFDWPLVCLSGRTNVEHHQGYPAYFCHFEVLGAHTDFLQSHKIGTLVLDEIHILQSKKSYRVQATCVLAPMANKVLGLSGTPMWNKPKSMYEILHLISPGAWGTRFSFRNRYCGAEPGAYGWTYNGATNTEELAARLGQISIRRTWAMSCQICHRQRACSSPWGSRAVSIPRLRLLP
jgi:hypothetical protein